VLINTDVYDAVHGSLRTAGLPAVDERIPFPGSGQQRRFAAAFATPIQMVAWDGTRRRMTVALPLRRPKDATIVCYWNSFALGVPRRRSLTTTPPRQPPGAVYLYCMAWSLDAYRARTASKCGSVWRPVH
jgi:hypothetical protein